MKLSLIVPLGGKRPSRPEGLGIPAGHPELELLVTASEDVPTQVRGEWRRLGFEIRLRKGTRGEGLREMAKEARSPLLLFVHGDTQLPSQWYPQVQKARWEGHRWGAFHLGFQEKGAGLRRIGLWLVALGANLRSRRGLPFGDQAPFFDKEFYLSLGGHPPFDLMEDYVLSQRAARVEAPAILQGRVRTSPNRYLDQGIFRTVLQNRRIIKEFRRSRPPAELARIYYQ